MARAPRRMALARSGASARSVAQLWSTPRSRGISPRCLCPTRSGPAHFAAAPKSSSKPPGTKPRAGQFPARNRIIAGLAEAVVVAEAAMRSGALITARLAREFGRALFAVPGSAGTDAYLRAGLAFPATSAMDTERVLAGGQP